jgi:hypothetical protein
MKINTINDGNKTTLEVGNDFAILFSYGTAVAVRCEGQSFKTDEIHSTTTSSHINGFADDPIEIPSLNWDTFLSRLTAKILRP